MRRIASSALVGVVVAATLWAIGLSVPMTAIACSCVPYGPLEEWRDEPNVAILTGTIVAAGPIGPGFPGGQDGLLGIERVYKGPMIVAAQMPIKGGDGAACGVTLVIGARVAMVATVEAGVLHPSLCVPYMTVGTAEGAAFINEAEDTYGPGRAPPAAAPATDPPATPNPQSADLALPISLGIVVLIAVVLFGGIALLARRGRGAT